MAWHLFGVNPLPNSMMSKLAAIFIRDKHYSDVILGTMASQITSLTSVYSTVYSGADKKKTSKLCVTGLCEGNSPVTGEFPAQIASNAENVSIGWRHHKTFMITPWEPFPYHRTYVLRNPS